MQINLSASDLPQPLKDLQRIVTLVDGLNAFMGHNNAQRQRTSLDIYKVADMEAICKMEMHSFHDELKSNFKRFMDEWVESQKEHLMDCGWYFIYHHPPRDGNRFHQISFQVFWADDY